MSEEPPPSEVLGSLPRTRPHRRSEKRASRAPAGAEPGTPMEGDEGGNVRPEGDDARREGENVRPEGDDAGTDSGDLLAGAVRTAAELAELGLSTGARALRAAVSRLPRP